MKYPALARCCILTLLAFSLKTPPSPRKPRCSSYQETNEKKASRYVSHTKELATFFSPTRPMAERQLTEDLEFIDEWFQNTCGWDSIIGCMYFPQSLINCVIGFKEGESFDRFDLLESLLIVELQHTKELNLTQTMLIFSTTNQLLSIFFAAVLATSTTPSAPHPEIKSLFKKVFAAQETLLARSFTAAPKLTRAHSV